MNCPSCKLVAMRVEKNNGEELELKCPRCGMKSKKKIEQEQSE